MNTIFKKTLVALACLSAVTLTSCSFRQAGDASDAYSTQSKATNATNKSQTQTQAKPLVAVTLAAASPKDASARDANIRKVVEEKLTRGTKVESIQPATFLPGFYEVRIGTDIFYVDEKAELLILGQVQNLSTGKNYTQERQDSLATAAVFSAESKANALKLVKGDGSREVAVFEDTNCGYCKKLRTELEKLNNVTIYTYLVPILSADSEVKMRGVWCAKDQNKAYDDWMLRNIEPAIADDRCQVPVEANQLLAQNLRVRGTPALFFSNGKRVPGYIKADQIEQELNAIK